MNVLIACEFSGVVRDAFIARGHNAWSCDLLPCERGHPHYQCDVLHILSCKHNWDMMIAHPPCTDVCVSGARWFPQKRADGRQQRAIAFAEALWAARIPKIVIENPISVLSTLSLLGKPAQIIQPWQFGHGETKATCLWLKGVQPLVPTNVVAGREHRIHLMAPSPDRAKERARTYQGIADAMASQWG